MKKDRSAKEFFDAADRVRETGYPTLEMLTAAIDEVRKLTPEGYWIRDFVFRPVHIFGSSMSYCVPDFVIEEVPNPEREAKEEMDLVLETMSKCEEEHYRSVFETMREDLKDLSDFSRRTILAAIEAEYDRDHFDDPDYAREFIEVTEDVVVKNRYKLLLEICNVAALGQYFADNEYGDINRFVEDIPLSDYFEFNFEAYGQEVLADADNLWETKYGFLIKD